MTQKAYYLPEARPREAIRSFVFTEMLRGAMYGAVVFFGVLVLIGAISLVGQLLPEESKQAPGPMPFSQLGTPDPVRLVG
jgi:hypothetical protein